MEAGVRFLQAAGTECADLDSAAVLAAPALSLSGFQFLPFKSRTWATLCLGTQKCYQVSFRPHTFINKAPLAWQAGSCWARETELY